MPVELHEERGRQLHVVRQAGAEIGFVAIDSTVDGRSRGGLRLVQDLEAAEMRDAARAMTLKYGFLGLPQGGAKAGILGDPELPVPAKRELLRRFAFEIKPLLEKSIYIPDADLGTTADDIRWMMQEVGIRVAKHDWKENLSGFYTAVSCLASAEAILAHRGQGIADLSVAIEGFGSVGGSLARLMTKRGAKVVAVSTSQGALYDQAGLDIEGLAAASREHGSAFVDQSGPGERISTASLLELDVDLLCPCARRHSIRAENVSRIQATLICAGANNPVDPIAERQLYERGIDYPPDFVSNSGGVLGGTLQFAGVPQKRIVEAIDRLLKSRMRELLVASESAQCPMRDLIESRALARHRQVCKAAESPTLSGRLLALGLAAYRRGLIPRAFVSGLTPLYMRRILRS